MMIGSALHALNRQKQLNQKYENSHGPPPAPGASLDLPTLALSLRVEHSTIHRSSTNEEHNMLRISDENESLISLTVDGKITEDDMETFTSSLEQKTGSSTGPFNALIDFKGFEGIEFEAIDDVLTSRPSANFGRVAIVGDGNVEKFASKIAKPFFQAEIKHFGSGESASARQWVQN
jgi:hypothetical protein